MTHLEEELLHLKRETTIMFMLVQTQLEKAQKALFNLDKDLAREVVNTEKRVNSQELKIDRDCENIFALYQPVAVDLRYVLAVLKINSNLERMGDIAEGIAKFVIDETSVFDADLLENSGLKKMFEEAMNMTDEIETAFNEEDTSIARKIFKHDEILDRINHEATEKISLYIATNTDKIKPALHVMSSIRKLERIGDQVKNIAEEIIFYIEAKVLKHIKKR